MKIVEGSRVETKRRGERNAFRWDARKGEDRSGLRKARWRDDIVLEGRERRTTASRKAKKS